MSTRSLDVICSRGLPNWLRNHQLSLAVTTYQAGKLMLLGVKGDGRLGMFERTFDRCMGLWADDQTLWMSSRFQLWRFENVLQAGELDGGFDRLYVPMLGHTAGDIDVHDVGIAPDGKPLFISTLFNCIATTGQRSSFDFLWRPPFISKLVAEDRCHLNGMAMHAGKPKYVTTCSRSDAIDGWRDRRKDGGCVLDVDTGETLASGFSMPHSPRLYQDRLWILDSGNGFLGTVDQATGQFEKVTFCPGHARGLSFVGDYAIVGLSRPRHDEQSFQGLALDDELQQRDTVARCGLLVIELNTGDVVEWVRFEGGAVEELCDVAVLPGVKRPKSLGFKTDEIQRRAWSTDEGRISSWSALG